MMNLLKSVLGPSLPHCFSNSLPAVFLLIFLPFISLGFFLRKQSQAIDYWLFLGTLPSLMRNGHRLIEWFTEVFISLGTTGSFFIEGPILSRLRYLVTCDPQNLEYILKTNFNNFPKGPLFKQIFDVLGDGIFNIDSDKWRLQRRIAHTAFTSGDFKGVVSHMTHKVVQEQLVPFLVHVAENGTTIDLQEICSRFAFDSNTSVIFGKNERYLSLELPHSEFAEAVDNAQETIHFRHTLPMFLWKLQRFLGVAKERRLSKDRATVDMLLQEYISQKREDLKTIETSDLLSTYIKGNTESVKSDIFLRDAMLSAFIAGRDTVTSGLVWFLWLVSRAPSVEMKILEELKVVFATKKTAKGETKIKWPWVFKSDDLKGLIYLHSALCESLRLYPPVPLNSKYVMKEDVLPDGSAVKPGMQILLSFYSVGRLPWIWGEDCSEFKPERWIDEDGKLRFELMSKLFAFNVGPRTCLGKDMAFTQMKSFVSCLLFNFHVEVVEGQHICQKPFITLHMKNGLQVKIKKREPLCVK